jgi:hypothetical protein
MGMSYQAKDSGVSSVQLKVQELCLKLSDVSVVSTSGSTATIDIQETISEIRSAIFVDDSAGTAAPVVASNRSVSGTQVVLTLSAAMAAADSIILKYVVSE